MTPFPLRIVTPAGPAFNGPVEWVIVPGEEGDFGIMAKHIPLIAAGRPGVVRIRRDGAVFFFGVGPSLIRVEADRTVILADRAVAGSDYEDARAKAG